MSKKKTGKPKHLSRRKKTAAKIRKDRQASGNAESMLQNAMALLQAGRQAEARQLLQQLLASPDGSPNYLNRLGVLAHMLGHSREGLKLLEKSVSLQPSAPFYNNLGLVQEQSGSMESARQSYEQAIGIDPDFSPAHYNLGNILQHASHLTAAVSHYREAIRCKPYYAKALNNLANALQKIGAFDEAEESCIRALRIEPSYAGMQTWYNIMAAQGDSKNILEHCGDALERMPNTNRLYATLGDILAENGRKSEAAAAYRKALTGSAQCGKIYYRLAMLKKFLAGDEDMADMERRHEEVSDRENLQFLSFALGKAYEDTRNYSQAFRYIQQGNRLARAGYTYSIAEDRTLMERLKTTFSPSLFARATDLGNPDQTPIFVIGMPRSGTTLVEQILSSHSRVYGAGELPELDRIISVKMHLKGVSNIGAGLAALDPQDYRSIGNDYLASLGTLDSTSEYIVDKMPQNYLWVGLIRIALPGAKIIHCRRDPMDTCWSIYKNIFDVPHKYAQDLDELGQYYLLYQDLMEYWKSVLPGTIHEIEYEQLILNQEHETRRLLEYCRLPWQDACLDFHRAERRVQSSSMAQVRKPLYASSIQIWHNYRDELQPLADIIQSRG